MELNRWILTYLLLRVVVDWFRMEYSRGRKLEPLTLIFIGGMLFFFALLVTIGVQATTILFTQELESPASPLLVLLLFALGYEVSRVVTQKLYGKSVLGKDFIMSQILSHYLIHSLFAIVFLIVSVFVLLTILNRLF